MPVRQKRNKGLGNHRKKTSVTSVSSTKTTSTLAPSIPPPAATTVAGDEPATVAEVDALLNKEEPLFDPEKEREMKRLGVAMMFVHRYGAPEMADRPRGMMKELKSSFGYFLNTSIDYILEDVLYCKKYGLTYCPKMKYADSSRTPIIQDFGGVEAQIIADAQEDGNSLRQTVNLLNSHTIELGNNNIEYSVSSVYSCIRKLKPKVDRVRARSSGSTDVDSAWCRASYGWATQQLVRFGHLESEKFRDVETGKIPAYYDSSKMPKLEEDQVGWFDECHKKCLIGKQLAAGKDTFFVFPRDENGKIDVANGTYSEEPKFKMKVKYDQEARFCFGAAVVTQEGSNEQVGVRCKPFDYSGKILLSIKDYKARQEAEMARVKTLSDQKGVWVIDPREEGMIYRDDDLTILKGCGEKTKEKLHIYSIKCVGDLEKELPKETRIALDILNVPMNNLISQAETCINEGKPNVIDYRREANPYKAKYGDEWEEVLARTARFSGITCITHLVEWIIASCEEMFRNSTHSDDWVFYHDALTLLTASDTVQWMKEKGYYDRWITPLNGLHQDQSGLSAYHNRPVGDHPENMPWDNSLNRDVHLAVDLHVQYTSSYTEDDNECKFSLSTPKRASYAYRRILHPLTGTAPSSERILHDVRLVFPNLLNVHEAKGKKDTTLVKNQGNRWVRSEVEQRGGRQTKRSYSDFVLHPHALLGRKVKLESSLEHFKKSKSSTII